MPNYNTLADVKCPNCGNEDEFRVVVTAWATVVDDGVDDYENPEWGSDARAICTQCKFTGTWDDLTLPHDEPNRHRITDEDRARVVKNIERLRATPVDMEYDLDDLLHGFTGEYPYSDVYLPEVLTKDGELAGYAYRLVGGLGDAEPSFGKEVPDSEWAVPFPSREAALAAAFFDAFDGGPEFDSAVYEVKG